MGVVEAEVATDRVARLRDVYVDAEDGEGGSTFTGVTSEVMSVTRGSRSERVDRRGLGGIASCRIASGACRPVVQVGKMCGNTLR
jgi:hypothetical protein